MSECDQEKWREIWMVRRIYTPQLIIGKLREAEVLLGQESTIRETARK